ncbi:MAG: hypothetical protein FJ224_05480 [Lentisphaerae bacterium]|nr:hypothetical protein [Lentisphaerota bacterium]
MNEANNAAQPECSPPPIPQGAASGSGNIVANLLKAQPSVGATIASGIGLGRHTAAFLLAAILCHAVFGLALGAFGGMEVAAMGAVKAPLIAVFSLLLCLPSLYVFSSVTGAPISVPQALCFGSSCAAMLGLILVGLAPVVWLFSVSTNSAAFMTVLTLALWCVALSFAGRYAGRLKGTPLFQRQSGIKLWLLILTVVVFQMTTCLRPMLAKSQTGLWAGEKKFFLSHFGSMF